MISIEKLWNLIGILTFMLTVDYLEAVPEKKLLIPNNYVALSSDLNIRVAIFESSSTPFKSADIKISELNEKSISFEIDKIHQHFHDSYNLVDVTVDCKYFLHGGLFELGVKLNALNSSADYIFDERLTQKINIDWPSAQLIIKRNLIGTYPEYPVEVILAFPKLQCEVDHLNLDPAIEFLLELIFCNKDTTCGNSNETNHHILYAEKVMGYPKSQLYTLPCELFGLAGYYAVRFRTVDTSSTFIPVMEFFRADWNQKFVFNVHARSIFPCDPHTGLGVLYEYPSCILDQADRIRLFGKLRADVASLKSPTSLHYVTEKKVVKGQHSLYFDCDIFSEKYVEYCFTYVSQSYSGAVADIRMDCVPTLPVTDSETGGWGPWSDWTTCSKSCLRGTRNRYRFCDSPAPRYGAKFCEGAAVQTEYCGGKDLDSWKCLYGFDSSSAAQNKVQKEVVAEIGPGCRCGCIVHLGSSKSKRVLAATAQSCPGRSFWLISAESGMRIRIKMEFIRLGCIKQSIKLRDGDSLSSNLISQYVGELKQSSEEFISSSSNLLLEFASDDGQINGDCKGGFLAKVQQIYSRYDKPAAILSQIILQKPRLLNTVVHLTVVIFSSLIIILSAILGAQYIHKYKKYHLTNNKLGQGSPVNTPRTSLESVQNLTSQAMSTTTLFSEVFYLVKIGSRNCSKHSLHCRSIVSDKSVNQSDYSKSQVTSKSDNEFTFRSEKSQDVKDHNDTRKILQSLSCENISDTIKINKEFLKYEKRAESDIPKRRIFHHVDMTNKSDYVPLNILQKNNTTISSTTLTNGYYSPAASIISKAAIRTTDQKEKKEVRNRAKLLSRPDSEFSLANPEDLELDYYDYDVINAAAAPGSYLGMDPAYLIWIPPFDDDEILTDISSQQFLDDVHVENNLSESNYKKRLPNYIENNTSTNIEMEQQPLDNKQKTDATLNSAIDNRHLVLPLKIESVPKQNDSSSMNITKGNLILCKSKIEASEEENEKETVVEKSSSDLQYYCDLADIRFVDE